MVSEYIQIHFADLQPEQKEILVAQLSEAGFEGFEETDDTLDAFIQEKEYDESLLHEIVFKYQLQFEKSRIGSANWNQVWESNFEPVIVEDFCAIRAGFHQPIENVSYEIEITPKMSFGTGHHATTYMMIRLMRETDFTGKSVFDFGTGTGILAILAEKLGAKNVLATDIDELSIDNAAENILNNNCSKIKIEKSGSVPENETFDIILANINKNVILENFSAMKNVLKADKSKLLLSGLLASDLDEIRKKSAELGLTVQKIEEKDNWICLQLSY